MDIVIYAGSFCATEVSSCASCGSFHWYSGDIFTVLFSLICIVNWWQFTVIFFHLFYAASYKLIW